MTRIPRNFHPAHHSFHKRHHLLQNILHQGSRDVLHLASGEICLWPTRSLSILCFLISRQEKTSQHVLLAVFKYCIFLVSVNHLPVTNEDGRGASLWHAVQSDWHEVIRLVSPCCRRRHRRDFRSFAGIGLKIDIVIDGNGDCVPFSHKKYCPKG